MIIDSTFDLSVSNKQRTNLSKMDASGNNEEPINMNKYILMVFTFCYTIPIDANRNESRIVVLNERGIFVGKFYQIKLICCHKPTSVGLLIEYFSNSITLAHLTNVRYYTAECKTKKENK